MCTTIGTTVLQQHKKSLGRLSKKIKGLIEGYNEEFNGNANCANTPLKHRYLLT
jgi:hypothetical protein